MRCKCNNKIPAGRIALGYSNCVNCSSTQQYSYIPIIANKQVLEIQIVSQELSDQAPNMVATEPSEIAKR